MPAAFGLQAAARRNTIAGQMLRADRINFMQTSQPYALL